MICRRRVYKLAPDDGGSGVTSRRAVGAELAVPVGMHLDPPADLKAHGFDPISLEDDMSKATEMAAWSDLEQEFFASAPPDEAEPPAEPAFFADLLEVPATRRRPAPRRTIAIVLGAIALLIGLGLSAAVLAAR